MIRSLIIVASMALGGCGSDGTTNGSDDANGVLPCTALTCGANLCGTIPDGCGADLVCGVCSDSEVCNTDGEFNQCRQACIPLESVFFDLGETLVTADGSGGFNERPTVIPLLENLRAQGLALGVITTVPESWTEADLRAILPRAELLDAFDVVLLSSQASSSPKPAPQIFTEALGLLPTPHRASRSIFVTEELGDIADTQTAPTVGARAAGMLGIHLSVETPSPRADYTLTPAELGSVATIVAEACAAD